MTTLVESKVETRRFVLPAQSNWRRTAHGGDLLKWMEQIGGMSAMHFRGGDAVTVGFDRGRFHGPIPQGAIALLDAYVYEVGTSSMTIRVRAFHEDHETGNRRLATEAKVVSVALDDDGDTTPVPELTVESDDGRRLRREAQNADE